MQNKLLNQAKQNKKDEFYTRYQDVANEVEHYTDQLKGKTIFCNCDEPTQSNFARYFINNFHRLGLQRLIVSCYREGEVGCWLDYYGVEGTEKNIQYHKGDGDFRSDEVVSLLTQSDVVVTNPPFSLFREYFGQLIEYGKKFLVISNQCSIAHKKICPYIVNGTVRLGYGFKGNVGWFKSDYVDTMVNKEHREGYIRKSGVLWFTNLDVEPKPFIPLVKRFNAVDYPMYDEYPVINVDKTADIPMDYTGVMGVPITFMFKYNPDQFELLGSDRQMPDNPHPGHCFHIGGKEIYSRMMIKNRHPVF